MKYNAIWTQVADRFKNHSDKLMFESINEQLFTDADLMDSLTDTIAKMNAPNIIATVHLYEFWPFSVNIAGYTKFDAFLK